MTQRKQDDSDVPVSPDPSAEKSEEKSLSPRQLQILEMLRAGKVNKEIASELGIGLGTVKQHVVALFKKLNVRNRVMAVSRDTKPQAESGALLLDEGLLEHRPCVVLSFVLVVDGVEGNNPLGRLLQQTMAEHAYDHDAIFLTRKQHAGDLIFGIQSASETLMTHAIHTAYRIVRALAAQRVPATTPLRAGITAGLAVASMNRYGGWSGEAIASAAISQSRALAEGAAAETLALGDAARDLLQVLAPSSFNATIKPCLHFDEMDRLPWRGFHPVACTEPVPLVLPGREAEMVWLDAFLSEASQRVNHTVYIEGEIGMGKSRLADYVTARAIQLGGIAYRLLCQRDMGEHQIFDLADGMSLPLPELHARLMEVLAENATPVVWVIDDCHLLPPAVLKELVHQACQANGRLIVFCGRHVPEITAMVDRVFHLGRIPQATLRIIALPYCPVDAGAADIAALLNWAMGVPLFAVELARHRITRTLPLSLRMVIGARMDRLKLDRQLLRQVACHPGTWDIGQLARSMREPKSQVRRGLDHAVASGVLSLDDQGRFSFAHPLLRQAIIQAKVE